MLEYVFLTADILVQSVYIWSLVHMYKDYLYMFICTRCTTFRSYLSYAKTLYVFAHTGWIVRDLIFPPFLPPPPGFSRGKKIILHILWILLLWWSACLLARYNSGSFLICHSTEALTLRLGLQGYFPKETFSFMCREKNRPSAKSLFIHFISQNSESWSFKGQILLNLKNQGIISSVI